MNSEDRLNIDLAHVRGKIFAFLTLAYPFQ
jgi:hypothetical protein